MDVKEEIIYLIKLIKAWGDDEENSTIFFLTERVLTLLNKIDTYTLIIEPTAKQALENYRKKLEDEKNVCN